MQMLQGDKTNTNQGGQNFEKNLPKIPCAGFFRYGVCRTCTQTNEISKNGSSRSRTKLCSRCRTVSYCSREHQLLDWTRHRQLCRIIANEHKYLKYTVTCFKELVKYKQQQGLLWQLKLGRKLSDIECQMFMFSRVCAICFKREPLPHCVCDLCTENRSISLFSCSKCLSEFYCSEEHQKQRSEIHSRYCQDLKLSLDMECYFSSNLPNLNGIRAKSLEEDLEFIFENPNFINLVVETTYSFDDLNYLFHCDQILSGITILYALQQVKKILKRKFVKPTMEVHILGPTVFECSLNWPLIIEIFFHWIKNLEKVHFVFVGPEIPEMPLINQDLTAQFCQKCQQRNLIIIPSNVYSCLYHEKLQELETPDLVVAFNSGLHEFDQSESDTWKESLEFVVKYREVPLILTAYTSHEIEQDLSRFKDNANVDVAYGPKKNPFSNRRPLLDWATEGIPVYFINDVLAVVKRTI